MKKTLLLMFAFTALVSGARAQAPTSLISGMKPTILTRTNHTYTSDELAMLTDGTKTTDEDVTKNLCLFYPNDNTGFDSTGKNDGFYFDLGETKSNIGVISIYWTGKHATNYKIYISDAEPSLTMTGTEVGSFNAAGTLDGKVYLHYNTDGNGIGKSGRYVAFIPTEHDNFWGSVMSEFEVFEYVAPKLTSFTATADKTALRPSETVSITSIAKDQFDVDIASASISYTGYDTSIIEVGTDGKVTAKANGTTTVTVKAILNSDEKTETISFTVETPMNAPTMAATQPTADIANVLVVYSTKYGYTEKTDNVNSYGVSGDMNPLFTTSEEVTLTDDSKAIHVIGKGFNARAKMKNGDEWTPTLATDYTKAFVALYPKSATSGRIFDDGKYDNGIKFDGLTPGQWNYVEVNASSLTTNFILVALDGETEFYLNHFYLTKPAAGEVEVNVTGNTAKVVGTVTSEKVSQIKTGAGTAAVLDLSSATISGDITLNLDNKNAVVVVGGTDRTPAATGADKVTANNGNIVVYDGTYYRAKGIITLVDEDASQPEYNFVINAQQDGVKYTRTIAAGKKVSLNSPVPVTIPTGVTVYKATKATTGEITFEVQEGKVEVGANEPVILHNTTGSDVVLSSPDGAGKSDLNLTANGAATSVDAIEQFGTSRAVKATGSEFALQDGALKQFNTGATIGAFRVYYKGLTSSARAIFIDGDVTSIGTIKADGSIEKAEVYDLQGRRVAHPTKGLYIVNGKKVIIK